MKRKYKTGDFARRNRRGRARRAAEINANGCDPKCKECTASHASLKGVVSDDNVYIILQPEDVKIQQLGYGYTKIIPKVFSLKGYFFDGKLLLLNDKPTAVKKLLPRLKKLKRNKNDRITNEVFRIEPA